VFAFLVSWARAKGCLRASENVFANFFRLKKVSATAAGAVKKITANSSSRINYNTQHTTLPRLAAAVRLFLFSQVYILGAFKIASQYCIDQKETNPERSESMNTIKKNNY